MPDIVRRLLILSMIALLIGGCGGHGRHGSTSGNGGHNSASDQNTGAANGQNNGPGPPGGDSQAEAPGAPYKVPNYGAAINQVDMSDPIKWNTIELYYWNNCPGHTQCVQLVPSYRAYPNHPEGGCEFIESDPPEGARASQGSKIVIWGTAPCPQTAAPAPSDTETPQPADSVSPSGS